jgi:hypothetical protein
MVSETIGLPQSMLRIFRAGKELKADMDSKTMSEINVQTDFFGDLLSAYIMGCF